MLRRLFSGAVCLLVVFGCSPPNIAVNTDYDRTVDFSEFKTYGWAPMDEEARARSQVDARIRQVVKNQLESKGVMEVEEDPDMVLLSEDYGADVCFEVAVPGQGVEGLAEQIAGLTRGSGSFEALGPYEDG